MDADSTGGTMISINAAIIPTGKNINIIGGGGNGGINSGTTRSNDVTITSKATTTFISILF
ncbi:hypothetical protein R6Q59_031963 [Mikania micrantha]